MMFRQCRRVMLRLLVLVMAAAAAQAADYVPGELYVKYASTAARTAGGSPESAIAALGGYDIRQAFPETDVLTARKGSAEQMERREALASIRRVQFPGEYDMRMIARKLSADPAIEYAEPIWIDHVFSVPNDPKYQTNQAYLPFVNAPEAWDIATGDSSVVIAIIDTAVDWQHPDLLANVWSNPGEIAGNGVDDDGNGKTDDIHGWDFFGSNGYDEDADPSPPISNGNSHGTHVAGIAAAATNNGTGVASLSYNVHFLPIKTGPGNSEYIYYGFDALLYAAACGADIANCSWGSTYYSRTNELIVETVVGEGVLIVAAAGNDGDDEIYYPAAYTGVLAVGAVVLNGDITDYSNYGSYVDVAAPGSNIYSTIISTVYGGYSIMSGTSMAAPVVSALAGLVKSHFPDADHDQVQAQILGGAQPLASQAYYLGAGYVDAAASLAEPLAYVDLLNIEYSDATGGNGDGIFRSGEVVDLAFDVRNRGIAVSGVTVSAEPQNGYLTLVSSASSIGSLTHGEETTADGIRLMVDTNAPVDAQEAVLVTFTGSDGLVGTGMFTVQLNPSYATFDANTIALSFDNIGHLGFADYPENTAGYSFFINNDDIVDRDEAFDNLVFEAGFMIGTGVDHVSDGVRGDDLTQDTDLVLASEVTCATDDSDGSETGTASFTDAGAGSDACGVTVDFTGYAYTDEEADQCLILSYLVSNTGEQELTGLRAGLFFDFDMPSESPHDDVISYDSSDDIVSVEADATESAGKITVGVTACPGIGSPWLIDNDYESSMLPGTVVNGPDFGIYDGFSDAEKWQALEGDEDALTAITGADISCVVAAPAFDLSPGGSHQIAFVLGYGVGYNDMKSQLDYGRSLAADIVSMVEDTAHDSQPEVFGIVSAYPNPFNPATVIEFASPSDTKGEIAVYSVTGQKVRTLLFGDIEAGYSTIRWDGRDDHGLTVATGVYLVRLSASGAESVHRVTLIK